MHNLEPPYKEKCAGDLHPDSAISSPTIKSSLPTSARTLESNGLEIILILGGYSYGSLVTTNLPAMSNILSAFINVVEGTAEAEIMLRALRLSTRRNTETQYHDRFQRGQELAVDVSMGINHATTVGGDEPQPSVRRTSKESRHSLDMVQRTMGRLRTELRRGKHSFEDDPTSPSIGKTPTAMQNPKVRVHYLLVSPLLPPISMFATMFSKSQSLQWSYPLSSMTGTKQKPSNSSAELLNHPTLAVYGDKDLFTSGKKLRRWAQGLANMPNSRFRFQEVAGAGHFWHEEGVAAQLRTAISSWVMDILNGLDE